jgi:hypothetical protein
MLDATILLRIPLSASMSSHGNEAQQHTHTLGLKNLYVNVTGLKLEEFGERMASLIRLCTINDCNNIAQYDYRYVTEIEQDDWLRVCGECITRYTLVARPEYQIRVVEIG